MPADRIAATTVPLFDLPPMRFRLELKEEIPNRQGKQVEQTPRWRPLAWCSNLFQVANLYGGLKAATAPEGKDPPDWSRPIRVIQITPDGKELGELTPDKFGG